MGALAIQDVDLREVFSMVCLIFPFRNRKFNSVNEAIEVIKDYFATETTLNVELIYFVHDNGREELFTLNFLLSGSLERDKQSILILDEITKDEADESWITIFK